MRNIFILPISKQKLFVTLLGSKTQNSISENKTTVQLQNAYFQTF